MKFNLCSLQELKPIFVSYKTPLVVCQYISSFQKGGVKAKNRNLHLRL